MLADTGTQTSDQAVEHLKSLTFSNLEDIIEFSDRAGDRAGDRAQKILNRSIHNKVKDRLSFVDTWKSREETILHIGLLIRSKHKIKYIDPLLDIVWIENEIPCIRGWEYFILARN